MWGDGSDTEIASRGDSSEGPRNDGRMVVTRRLLRGEIQVRDLATTGGETSQRRGEGSDTEIASGGGFKGGTAQRRGGGKRHGDCFVRIARSD
ncbi:MAG: hypothetical protein FWG98_06360, partial [Candidatus Cloacimonetes bacterium]|nr:hypothetical protein [Candidatus Cloacimonadota bacterium]